MISPVILVGFATIGLAWLLNYVLAQLRKYSGVNKLPGPPALQLLWITISSKSGYEKYQYISSLNKKYGPVVKLWIKPFSPTIMVADVQFVDKVLMSKDHLQKSKMYDLLKPYMGEGIATTSNVEEWRRGRKLCNVAFQHSTVTGFMPMFTKYTDKFMDMLKTKTGKPIETQKLTHLYTLDIIFESLTKQMFNFQQNNNSVYLNARIDYFEILRNRLYSIFMQNQTLFKFTSSFKIMDKAVNIIKNFTYEVIQSKDAEKQNGHVENSKLHLIDILYENNVEGQILNDQINTFILAGHDTIGQGMCYTLFALSRHPEIQQKLFKEITSVVGEDPNAEIAARDLQTMKYLEAVVKESSRLYTIVPVIERKVSYPIDVDGIHYPAGTMFMFNLNGVHQNEKYFPNPQKFDPERFMPENAHLAHKNSFLTFSVGPRDCIGKLYAMLVIKFFVAKVVQKFQILPVEEHKLKIVNEIIAKSENGIPVILKERATT